MPVPVKRKSEIFDEDNDDSDDIDAKKKVTYVNDTDKKSKDMAADSTTGLKSTDHPFVERFRRHEKISELKLRGVVDNTITDTDDKVWTFLHLRKHFRVMHRFKSYVYFYLGTDEEHVTYDERRNLINHLYYESNFPGDTPILLVKYMYLKELGKNKSQRDQMFKLLKEKEEAKNVNMETENNEADAKS